MANKRTYTIEIQGVKESYEDVKTLAEVLDSLTDKFVKISPIIDNNVNTVEKSTDATKSNTSETNSNAKAADSLSKAKQKLEEFDLEYQKELAQVNAQLSQSKKEIKEVIQQEQAQAIVDAKQLDSYADKQKYLTSLNKLIKNHSNVTEEDKAEIAAMVQESAKLQSELKEFDEQMKIYTRNVGNYPEAAQMVIESNKSIKQELRELTAEMANMLANGVDKTDPKFVQLAERAGTLRDAMNDASDEIKHFASDTAGLDNAINLAQTATSVWGLYTSAMAVFGEENEEVAQSMQKMMAIMQTLQSLQQLQTNLTANGSATAKIYTAVTNALAAALGLKTKAVQNDTTATVTSTAATTAATTATQGATLATKALSVAIKSIPLMFVIGLVIALIQNWENIVKWFERTFPPVKKLTDWFGKMGGMMTALKGAAIGLGKAIIQWIINPYQTLAKVLERLVKLDFKGAAEAMAEGLKNQFQGTAKAFKEGFQEQVEKGYAEMSAKAAETSNKTTKQELEELKIRERNNKTYSDRYIALQKKDFEERKKMAKGNKDELNKIKLEEMQFDAEVEDKKTAYAKEQQDKKTKDAQAAAAERKKALETEQAAAKKLSEEHRKRIETLSKDTEKNISEANKQIIEAEKLFQKQYDELLEKNYKNSLKYYGEIINNEKYAGEFKRKEAETAENYASKSLMARNKLVIQNLFIEAEEAKKQYQKIIDDTKNLIEKTRVEIYTASGDTRAALESDLHRLESTLAETTKTMEKQLGNYAKEEIVIPFNFDEDLALIRFRRLSEEFEERGKEIGFTLQEAFETAFGTGTNVQQKINEFAENLQDAVKKGFSIDSSEVTGIFDEYMQYFTNMAKVLNLPNEKLNEVKETLVGLLNTAKENDPEFLFAKAEENAEVVRKAFIGLNSDITKFGDFATDKFEEIGESGKKLANDLANSAIEASNKSIDKAENTIKRFQEMTKTAKIEPVMVDDAFSSAFEGQIMSIEKTRERYKNLKEAYEEYANSLKEGSEQRLQWETAWQNKLEATAKLYGEDSQEYKNLIDDKKKQEADFKVEYENAQTAISEIDKKTNNIRGEAAQKLSERISKIYSDLSKNVFDPLAEGFTSLLEFQLEEAREKLEEIEDMLDDAVDKREESQAKIEEINSKLRDSNVMNKENLKQQLADEQVLLVQREQSERDLQRQKEKQEAEIQKKEKQQRKIELGQKLIETIANTAVGVTAALKYGPILGPIFAAIIGAMGAMQSAIIVKQISKLERGGKIKNSGLVRDENGKGKLHSQGGHRIEGTNIEVELDEWVINRKSSKKYNRLITAINDDNEDAVQRIAASRKFENGGIIGSTIPTPITNVNEYREARNVVINNYNSTNKNFVNSAIKKYAQGGQLDYRGSVEAVERQTVESKVSDAIKQIDFKPVVSVVDINKKQNSLVKVQDISGK